MPESALVTTLDLQVQVQTRFGLSRTVKATFPRCPGNCQNGGSCWWSKDDAQPECVCPARYYGGLCENGSQPSSHQSIIFGLAWSSPQSPPLRACACACACAWTLSRVWG
jgi:hypothetical protein